MNQDELIRVLDQIASYCNDDNESSVREAAKLAGKLIKRIKKEGVVDSSPKKTASM